jgi:glycosyltransferase involved in cell wall biosynthesis
MFLARAPRNRVDNGFFGFRDFDVVDKVKQGRYEVLWIHGYNHLTHQLAAITQLLSGRAVLLREEQTLIHPRPAWKTAIKRLWFRTVLRRAFALYIGTENQKWFLSMGIPPERMFFTPYCVDNDWLRRQAARLEEDRQRLRASFGLHPDRPIVLSVGRLVPKKQPELLLRAFESVRKVVPCSLLIVGSGQSEDALRAAVAERAIPDVRLLGFRNQSQITEAYAASDIFVLPSKEHETWGLVVNEAMNFGLPIVATDKVGAGTDLVSDGSNGYIVSAYDPAPMAQRLGELLLNQKLRERFGSLSRAMIEPWNYEAAAKGVVAAVAAAVGERRWSDVANVSVPAS